MEQARTAVAIAADQCSQLCTSETGEVVEAFRQANSGMDRLNGISEKNCVQALRRFRQACVASSLRGSIVAEADGVEGAADALDRDVANLSSRLFEVGHAFVRGKKDSPSIVYDDLLHKEWKEIISPDRLDRWARRFDPEIGGLAGIVQHMRNGEAWRVPWSQASWPDPLKRDLPLFADLLDGAYEDVDRLRGAAIEYHSAADMGLTIHQFRTACTVPDTAAPNSLVYFVPKSRNPKGTPSPSR